MKRICIVRHAYYPQETHVRRNAETLVRRGHSVSLICLRGPGQSARETISDIEVYRLPVQHHRAGLLRYLFEYGAFFILAAFTLARLHIRHRFDSIEVDTMPDFLVFCTFVPKLMKAKIVLYLFEAMPEEFAAKYGLRQDHVAVRVMEIVEQLAIRYSDHVITACEAFRAVFVARGADNGKITVILNVPNETVFQGVAEVPPQKPLEGAVKLITHGTLIELYGVQVVIRAMALLKQDLPGAHVTIAGDGEYLQALRTMTESLNLTGSVTFTGWIPQDQIVQLIREADIGLVPILGGYGEMMVPNKLFEYVSLGKPVISSSLRGIRDYFDTSCLMFHEPGNEAEMANCIRELVRQPSLRTSMARAALQVYNRHRWDVSKETYCNVHERA